MGNIFILEYLIIQLVVAYKSEVVLVPPLDPWAFMHVRWLVSTKLLIIINERLGVWLVAEFYSWASRVHAVHVSAIPSGWLLSFLSFARNDFACWRWLLLFNRRNRNEFGSTIFNSSIHFAWCYWLLTLIDVIKMLSLRHPLVHIIITIHRVHSWKHLIVVPTQFTL